MLLRVVIVILLSAYLAPALGDELITMGNSHWPPFVIKGNEEGRSEELVCQALANAGYGCTVVAQDWTGVLEKTRSGELDGIAAAWYTEERATFLIYSDPYLTNRLVPVMKAGQSYDIKSLEDLSDLRVAMGSGFAYGEQVQAAEATFERVDVANIDDAIAAVRNGNADITLIDELVARDLMGTELIDDIVVINAVLAYRELHFAMSRTHPRAEEIVAKFNHAFELMLQDGTVNEILEVDWLATDLGSDGSLDLVLRSGVELSSLVDPSLHGSTYALGQSNYNAMKSTGFDSVQVDGKSHSDLESALIAAFGKRGVCARQEWTSKINCTLPD